jgi:hypothetical protein
MMHGFLSALSADGHAIPSKCSSSKITFCPLSAIEVHKAGICSAKQDKSVEFMSTLQALIPMQVGCRLFASKEGIFYRFFYLCLPLKAKQKINQ